MREKLDCEKAVRDHLGRGDGSWEECVGRASEVIAWFQHGNAIALT